MDDGDWLIRGILVSNLPTSDDVTRDKLEIHFSKNSNGGGDVENIIMLDDYTAMVKFKNKETVESVLAKNSQCLLDTILNVTRYTKSVAEKLKTSRNVNRSRSFHRSENNADYCAEGVYDEYDEFESGQLEQQQSTFEECSCNDLFKIFEQVSGSIPFEKLEAHLPEKHNTLNRMSVHTGIRWEVDNPNQRLILTGCFDELKRASVMLRHYTNDDDIQNEDDSEKPNNTKSESRAELPYIYQQINLSGTLNAPQNTCTTERGSSEYAQKPSSLSLFQNSVSPDSVISKKVIENHTPVDDKSGTKRQSRNPTLKLRSSTTDDNLQVQQRPSEQSPEESLDEYETRDLEIDLDDEVSERSQVTNGLKVPHELVDHDKHSTAKIDVVCLDSKLANYVFSIKKTEIEEIQKQFSVKFITTNSGRVTLEVRRDNSTTRNAKHAIEEFQTILGKIIKQDPKSETINFNDFNFTDKYLKQIWENAKKANPEITVNLDDYAACLQIYGTNSAITNALDWFSTQMLTVRQLHHDKPNVRLQDEDQTIQHEVTGMSCTGNNGIEQNEQSQIRKMESMTEYIPEAAAETSTFSNTINIQTNSTESTFPKKEEISLVKSALAKTGEARAVTANKSSHLETVETERHSSEYAQKPSSLFLFQNSVSPDSVISKKVIENHTPVDDKSGTERQSRNPTLKLRSSTTDDNLQGQQRPSEQSPEESLDEYETGDLEIDWDDEVSERSQVTKGLKVPRELVAHDKHSTAKIDVVCLDSKLANYVFSIKKTEIKEIQKQFSVKFITTNSGRVTLEVRRDNSTTRNAKHAIEEFQTILGKIIKQDPKSETINFNDFNFTDKYLEQICENAKKANPEITVNIDDYAACLQIYGTNSAITNALDWFSTQMLTVRKLQHDKPNVRLQDGNQTIQHEVTGMSCTGNNGIEQNEQSQVREMESMTEYIPEAAAETSTFSNTINIQTNGTEFLRKEEISLVKSALAKTGEAQAVIANKSSHLETVENPTTQYLDQGITKVAPSGRSSLKCGLNSSDHFVKIPADITPKRRRNAVEKLFDQKILNYIQAVHYNDINEFRNKYEVEYEMKGNGTVQVCTTNTGCTSNVKLQKAVDALDTLVESLTGHLVTQSIDLRDFAVPQKDWNKSITEAKRNKNILVINSFGNKIDLFGTEKEIQMALDDITKSGKIDYSPKGKLVRKQNARALPVDVSCPFGETRGLPENGVHRSALNLIPKGIASTRNVHDTTEATHQNQRSYPFYVPKSHTGFDTSVKSNGARGEGIALASNVDLIAPYGDQDENEQSNCGSSENSMNAESERYNVRDDSFTVDLTFDDESDDDTPAGGLVNDMRLYGDLDCLPDEAPAVSAMPYVTSDTLTLNTSAGFDIEIREGDITREFVSVIVSSADPYLENKTAVARAIKDAAGVQLIKECQKWVETRGTVDISRPVWTSGGNLLCSQVLHVITPDNSSTIGMSSLEGNPLTDMLQSVLKICTHPLKATSIAMPAIGIDSLQMGKERYAEYLFDAVALCILSPPVSRKAACELQRLIIVDQNASLVKHLQAVFKAKSSEPKYKRLFEPRLRRLDYNNEDQLQLPAKWTNSGARSKVKYGSTNKTRQINHQYSQHRRGHCEEEVGSERSIPARFNDEVRSDDIIRSQSSSLQQDGEDSHDDTCPVCLDVLSKPSRKLKCKHTFCKRCLDQSVKHQGETCPVCKEPFGKGKRVRTMPPGKMDVRIDSTSTIPAYPDSKGTIIITYSFTSGIQGPLHPNPGRTYKADTRTAYLPDTPEGRDILNLLKRAFDSRLTFTIGTSSSSGQRNVIVWNDIHHKTAIRGGSENHGYPDPTYLARVRKELEDKGIR